MWWPVLKYSGMNISNLVDTGVSPGRRFQLLFTGLSLNFRAAYSTFFSSSQSRYPSGLTLAHQPAHSPHPKANYSLTHTLAVSALMPLSICRFIAANNRCSSGFRAALPKLLLIRNLNPMLSRLTHWRLRTASLLLHCLSAAV